VTRSPAELASILRTLARGLPFHQDALREAADVLDPPDQGHVIELRDGPWALQHPWACRPNLLDCPVQQAAMMVRHANQSRPPCGEGRFACWVAPDTGLLTVGERVG
jgi:hypothetical protein